MSKSPALATAEKAQSRWATRYNNVLAKHREGVREGIGTGITTVTAVGLGYFEEKYPDAAKAGLLGIPVPLVVGVAGLACGMLGVGGADAAYFTDLGRGGMAAWGYGMGKSLAKPDDSEPAP